MAQLAAGANAIQVIRLAPYALLTFVLPDLSTFSRNTTWRGVSMSRLTASNAGKSFTNCWTSRNVGRMCSADFRQSQLRNWLSPAMRPVVPAPAFERRRPERLLWMNRRDDLDGPARASTYCRMLPATSTASACRSGAVRATSSIGTITHGRSASPAAGAAVRRHTPPRPSASSSDCPSPLGRSQSS